MTKPDLRAQFRDRLETTTNGALIMALLAPLDASQFLEVIIDILKSTSSHVGDAAALAIHRGGPVDVATDLTQLGYRLYTLSEVIQQIRDEPNHVELFAVDEKLLNKVRTMCEANSDE